MQAGRQAGRQAEWWTCRQREGAESKPPLMASAPADPLTRLMAMRPFFRVSAKACSAVFLMKPLRVSITRSEASEKSDTGSMEVTLSPSWRGMI